MLLAGCLNKHPAPPSSEEVAPMELLWSKPYEYAGSSLASPLSIGDSVVIMAAGVNIEALNSTTGDLIWQTLLDSGISIQTLLFVTDEENIFVTHVKDVRSYSVGSGELQWITELSIDSGVLGDEIVLFNGKVYVGGFHHVYCLDANTGEILWSKLIGASTAVDDLSRAEDKLLVATGGDRPLGVIVLDINSGDSLASFSSGNQGKVLMAPIVKDSIVYFGQSWIQPFALEAWNLNTYEMVWRFELQNVDYICDHGIIIDDLLVVTLAPFGIGAWNLETSEPVWEIFPSENYNWSRIGYDGNMIYFQHGWELRVISPQAGEVVYSTRGRDSNIILDITVTEDKVLAHGWPENMCFSTYNLE